MDLGLELCLCMEGSCNGCSISHSSRGVSRDHFPLSQKAALVFNVLQGNSQNFPLWCLSTQRLTCERRDLGAEGGVSALIR